MIAHIRFSGDIVFEKTVELESLPDVGDFVRVRPPQRDSEDTFAPLSGIVQSRSFVEMDYGRSSIKQMDAVIDVVQTGA